MVGAAGAGTGGEARLRGWRSLLAADVAVAPYGMCHDALYAYMGAAEGVHLHVYVCVRVEVCERMACG